MRAGAGPTRASVLNTSRGKRPRQLRRESRASLGVHKTGPENFTR